MSYVANKFIEAKAKVMKKRSDRYMKKREYDKSDKLDVKLDKFLDNAESYAVFEQKLEKLLDKANYLFGKEHKKKTSLKRSDGTKRLLKNKASIELKTAEVLLGAVAFVPLMALYGAAVGIERVVEYKPEKTIVDEFVKVIESAQNIEEVHSCTPVEGKEKSVFNLERKRLLVRYNDNNGDDHFALIQNGNIVADVKSKQGIRRIAQARNKKLKILAGQRNAEEQAETIAALKKMRGDR